MRNSHKTKFSHSAFERNCSIVSCHDVCRDVLSSAASEKSIHVSRRYQTL